MRTNDLTTKDITTINLWIQDFVTTRVNRYLDTVIPDRRLPRSGTERFRFSDMSIRHFIMNKFNEVPFQGSKHPVPYAEHNMVNGCYQLGTAGVKHFESSLVTESEEPQWFDVIIETPEMDILVQVYGSILKTTNPQPNTVVGYDVVLILVPHAKKLQATLVEVFPYMFNKTTGHYHQDINGQPVQVGDTVAFSTGTARLYTGTVTGLTDKGIRVDHNGKPKVITQLQRRVVKVSCGPC